VAAQTAALPPLDEEQLTQRVLGELQRQIDVLLEQRLREALAPVLARLTDSLVRDVRGELASTLRELVARAVAQELSRHRKR
jgi:alkylhydroperoxidase family enzyme